MQKITPFLWFDMQAEEAAHFYTSIFEHSKINGITRYTEAGHEVHGMPAGTAMTVSFELDGEQFIALNGGPLYKFTPAVSFMVSCNTKGELDELWNKLSEGGTILMEVGEYPFSKRFGWLNDKFGVSWQLIIGNTAQTITPALMFVGSQHGKAGNAMTYYTSLFKNSSIVKVERYGPDEGDLSGTVKHATFSLNGQEFMAMDSGREHPFGFTPATSFYVNCETQAEVDRLWHKLSEGGSPGQCGWIEDQFGLAWQIIPSSLTRMMGDKDPEKSKRVVGAMLKMRKLDIKSLEDAYNGN